MSAVSALPRSRARSFAAALAAEGRGRHGVQLAFAVVVSYAVSSALGLPESFWAVMSALIVVRSSAGATLGAGGLRLAGTLLGTLAGLAGVWLSHAGIVPPLLALAVVAVLAFGGALSPLFASAPIAALIVLSSTALPGHPVLQVAALRSLEVGIGVACGMAVSLVLRGAGAGARFAAGCAALLRGLADALARDGDAAGADATGARRDADGDVRTRAALRSLALLAAGADLEARLSARLPQRRRTAAAAVDPQRYRRLVRLLARVHQDAAMLGRALAADAAAQGPDAVHAARTAAVAALRRVADAWDAGDGPGAAPGARGDAAGLDAAGPMARPALRFLAEDLALLARAARARTPR